MSNEWKLSKPKVHSRGLNEYGRIGAYMERGGGTTTLPFRNKHQANQYLR